MSHAFARMSLATLTGLAFACTAAAQPARPAGTPTMGSGVGVPSGGRQAGVPTQGLPQAGNPLSTTLPSGNSTRLPSGNVSFPNTTTSNRFPGTFRRTPLTSGSTTGRFPNQGLFFPKGLGFTYGGNQYVPDAGTIGVTPGVNGVDTPLYGSPGISGYPGTEFNSYGNGGIANQFNLDAAARGSMPTVPLTALASDGSSVSAGEGNSATDNVVRLRLIAPSNATIWIDGQPTMPTGQMRDFVSPPIHPNREYGYDIRAEWNEGGREVKRQRHITFYAGDRLTVNLLTGPATTSQSNVTVHQTLKPTAPDASVAAASPVYRPPPPRANFVVRVDETAYDGVVTSVTATTLHVAGDDKQQHVYQLAPGAQITCDNSACPLTAIKPGMRVRVTTKNNNLHAALRVEAIDQNTHFVQPVR